MKVDASEYVENMYNVDDINAVYLDPLDVDFVRFPEIIEPREINETLDDPLQLEITVAHIIGWMTSQKMCLCRKQSRHDGSVKYVLVGYSIKNRRLKDRGYAELYEVHRELSMYSEVAIPVVWYDDDGETLSIVGY